MSKKTYKKPNFVAKDGKSTNAVPAALAAAAGAVAAAAATSAVKAMFEEDHHDGTLFSLTPVKIAIV